MSNSLALELPHILPAQAQKHVTHNEAIDLLDAIVQLSVISRGQNAPPVVSVNGNRFLVGGAATGDWAGHDNEFALFLDGGWLFRTPREGWRLWVEAEQIFLVLTSLGWRAVGGEDRTTQNAIINGAFDIWQRGVGPISGSAAGTYAADRWRLETSGAASIAMSRDVAVPNAVFSYSAYCQIAGVTSTDQITLRQIVENGDRLIASGDVTLAFWLRGPTGASVTYGIDSAQAVHMCSGTWELVQSTFSNLTPQPNNVCDLILLSDLSMDGGYSIAGAQLVAGSSISTSPQRSAGQEDALCRRYFERLGGGDRQLGRFQNAFGAQVPLNPILFWSTPKRVVPNITALGDVNDGAQQVLSLHHIEPTHAVLGQQVPAFGWLDIDAIDVEAEY
ncbi:MAG: DUF2793 domain-containing protein [Hyphomicrobiales bacterium]